MPSELIGHGWVNAIAKEDRKRLVENWQKAVDEDRELIDEFRFVTPDGERIPATVHSYKMVGRDNDTIGYLGICHIEKGD
jgi:PAS domain S-box-containing protein